jgi:hypothetical protein
VTLRLDEPLALPSSWEFRDDTPKTRAECVGGQRPCPFVKCRHHLWLDPEQDQSGNWQKGRQGFTSVIPHTMESCALDVAEVGATPDQIGKMLDIDNTRVRQILDGAITKLRRRDKHLAAALHKAMEP